MHSNNKILIIDKNEKNRRFLSQFLEGFSLATREISSLSEAANILFKSNNFALILISQTSMEENFIKLLHSLKASDPLLGVILLSEIQDNNSAISLLEDGTIDHIATLSNLSGVFSAIKNEFHKIELIRKNEFFQKKIRGVLDKMKKSAYIWYSGPTDNTGKRLAEALKAGHGKTKPTLRMYYHWRRPRRTRRRPLRLS